MRRVALVDAYPHVVGGASLVLLALADRAASSGWRPTLHVFGPGDAVPDAAAAQGLEVRRHPMHGPLSRYGGAATAGLAARVGAVASAGVSWVDGQCRAAR